MKHIIQKTDFKIGIHDIITWILMGIQIYCMIN